MDEIHVESLVDVLRKGHQWAFSLRKIVDQEGKFICLDKRIAWQMALTHLTTT